VIRNWVHIEELDGSSVEIRRRLGWGAEAVVLHTGNMGLKQGLENVIDAARLAERRGDEVRFVLMGDGNQRATLERLAADVRTIDVVDPLPDADYLAALRAADVLLVNERKGMAEMSVPSKLTSYFSAGRPVVAATDPGSPTASEMRASGAGPIVPSGDPEALLTSVLTLAADAALAATHGAAARSFAQEHFDAEKALARYDAWIDRIVAARR
jgi:glycosyltransferase involved in cell wall biosynthesis